MSGSSYLGEMLAIASAMAWAVGVVLFRQAGRSVHPLALNFFKNSLSLILLFLTSFAANRVLIGHLSDRDVYLLLAAGFVGMGISDTFMLASLNRLGAGLSSILWTLYTPMVIGLSVIFLGERLTVVQFVGVLAVMTALVLVVSINNGKGPRDSKSYWVGVLWALAAMLFQAVSVVGIKPALERTPIFVATELRLMGGLMFLLPVLYFRRDRGELFRSILRPSNLKFLLPGSIAGTYLALTLMLGGVKYTLASTATVLNQTSNLFIFLLAILFLRETAGVRRVVGIILGVAGAVLVTLGGS